MKLDIAQTPVFRKFGAKGMRIFCIAWGLFMYVLLISISVNGLFALTQIENEGAKCLLVIAVALIVAAASLLTRMLIGTFRELQSLESWQKK